MLVVVLILLGIVCEIVKANAWFVIPEFISYILFGLGGIILVINIISALTAKSRFNKASREINKRFDRW